MRPAVKQKRNWGSLPNILALILLPVGTIVALIGVSPVVLSGSMLDWGSILVIAGIICLALGESS